MVFQSTRDISATSGTNTVVAGHPICLVAHDVDLPPLRVGGDKWHLRTIRHVEDIHTELRAIATIAPAGARMLDLIGHSTREHCFLRIGETAVDACRPAVARVFEAIRGEGLLGQLGVTAVRLLGCSTASRPTGQRSLRRLARILQLPVFGSTKDLLACHYTADGFNPKFERILVEAAELHGAVG